MATGCNNVLLVSNMLETMNVPVSSSKICTWEDPERVYHSDLDAMAVIASNTIFFSKPKPRSNLELRSVILYVKADPLHARLTKNIALKNE